MISIRLCFLAIFSVPSLAHLKLRKPMGAGVAKAIKDFEAGKMGQLSPHDMENLSPECKKAAENHRQEMADMKKNTVRADSACPTTPCVGRLELIPKGESAIHRESPMCLPKECQNRADIKSISSSMNEVFRRASGSLEEVDGLTIEIDCSASGGPDQGSGGDKEITTHDDFVTDANPLPEKAVQGHPAAARTTYDRSGAFTLPSMVSIILIAFANHCLTIL
eukprot:gnl/MRDRNA2_/MRDRNA2_87193_c0_seq1.p1 gnl/MRDRNA2_/MRDRNA2_87193_c0~~gnl/MRDRNA2_/MRDRNA2_87193_c0_seq1.p1  ORF type:complete len:222 (-),score=41.64 gnl/MRDRNA2_/MRDRNA2_87193_c0_seq1:86-751(-)